MRPEKAVARANQAEHVQEMLEGHCIELLACLYVDSNGEVQVDPEKQERITFQISRLIGHKGIWADHLGIEPYQYAVKQLYPYDESKW